MTPEQFEIAVQWALIVIVAFGLRWALFVIVTFGFPMLRRIRDTTPAFKPIVGCETVRVRMGGGGGGGQSSANMTGGTGGYPGGFTSSFPPLKRTDRGGAGGPGIAKGIMIVEEYYEMDVPDKSIIDASHEIAALAVSQRDSVNMYSAVREKAVEVLTRLAGLAGSKPQS